MTLEPLVYVIDPDGDERRSLSSLLDSVGFASRCYGDPESLLAEVDYDRPSCLISDLRMPGMSGLELQSRLAEAGRVLPVIFVTAHSNVTAAVRAMHAGAVDFLTKPVDGDHLIQVVRQALDAETEQLRMLEIERSIRERLEQLTPREREVLDGVVSGLSNKEIARELGISYKTVELHRSHMMEKMRAQSIAEVTRLRLCIENVPANTTLDSVSTRLGNSRLRDSG